MTELAHLADITLQQLHEIKSLPVSTHLDETDVEALKDRLEPAVEEVVVRHLSQSATRNILRELSQRERTVLEERYGFNGEARTLDDIGRTLGLTRERIRQIENQALEKLRHLGAIAALAPVRRHADADLDEAATS
jgi:RNA polymerase primary sigma factor